MVSAHKIFGESVLLRTANGNVLRFDLASSVLVQSDATDESAECICIRTHTYTITTSTPQCIAYVNV